MSVVRSNPSSKKRRLFRAQRRRCAGCRGVFTIYALTFDHKEPRSKGGTDSMENLQLLCYECNQLKSTSTQAEFMDRITALIRLHGPTSWRRAFKKAHKTWRH